MYAEKKKKNTYQRQLQRPYPPCPHFDAYCLVRLGIQTTRDINFNRVPPAFSLKQDISWSALSSQIIEDNIRTAGFLQKSKSFCAVPICTGSISGGPSLLSSRWLIPVLRRTRAIEDITLRWGSQALYPHSSSRLKPLLTEISPKEKPMRRDRFLT